MDYKQLYMNQLRYCEDLQNQIALLREKCDVASMQAKNASIRSGALEKRVVELERRVQGLEGRSEVLCS